MLTRPLLVTVFLLGCADPGSSGDDDATTPVTATAKIGPRGGVVAADGFRLTLPEGALEGPVDITVVDTGQSPPAAWTGLSPIWRVQPEALQLLRPAEVAVRFQGAPETASLFWGPAGAPFQLVEASRSGSVLTGSIGAFGRGFVAAGSEVFESWTPTIRSLDLLFVVDNSASMLDEQNELIAAFPGMMQALVDVGVDYHIGVISTDMDDPLHQGRIQGDVIDLDTADPVAAFADAAALGANGSGDERGLGAAFAALDLLGDGANAGFRRVEADLAAVVLSDEEDATDTMTVPDFVAWYDTLTADVEARTFSSIVNPPGCCGPLDPESAGLRYIEVTQAIGGRLLEIRNGAYDDVVIDLVTAPRFEVVHTLAQAADPTSLVLTATEPGGAVHQLAGTDYVYDEATWEIRLTLAYRPPPETAITIRYRP